MVGAFEAMKPSDVVISVASDNRHDHPHDDMLAIYEDEVRITSIRPRT